MRESRKSQTAQKEYSKAEAQQGLGRLLRRTTLRGNKAGIGIRNVHIFETYEIDSTFLMPNNLGRSKLPRPNLFIQLWT